jgi:diketogulonate reductase-like aldo/keto reductase
MLDSRFSDLTLQRFNYSLICKIRLQARSAHESFLKANAMKRVRFPDGEQVPALGQGTWHMGEKKRAHAEEVAALRLGVDLGMTLIDTAEMYGEGGAEKVVADAIDGQREGVFVVTKVYPHNASRTAMPKACERSLKHLRIETIDLYLLHWQGDVPLAETVETFEQLRATGKIRRWGVSNFDLGEMKELMEICGRGSRAGGTGSVAPATNQVLYNIGNRGIEFDLLPWSQRNKIPIMAYAPIGHGRGLLNNTALKTIAKRHGATPAQIALAWVLRESDVIAIPKASSETHVRENAGSAKIKLTKQDLQDLDDEFPRPKSKQPLAML